MHLSKKIVAPLANHKNDKTYEVTLIIFKNIYLYLYRTWFQKHLSKTVTYKKYSFLLQTTEIIRLKFVRCLSDYKQLIAKS